MVSVYLPPSVMHFSVPWPSRHPNRSALPLLFDVVGAFRPALIVELHAAPADTYFAMCEAVRHHGLPTLVYGFDDWGGTSAASPPEADFLMANRLNRENYTGFSYLVHMEPAQAQSHFADASIDMLTIRTHRSDTSVDGLWRAWQRALAPGGLLVVDGLADPQSAAARWWADLTATGRGIRFDLGGGVGLWRKPGGGLPAGELPRLLFGAEAGDTSAAAVLYDHIAEYFAVKDRPAPMILGDPARAARLPG